MFRCGILNDSHLGMTEELVRKTGISLGLVVFVDNVLSVVVMIIIELLLLLLDIVLVILRAGIPDNVTEVSNKIFIIYEFADI